MTGQDIRQSVRDRYAQAAQRVLTPSTGCCATPTPTDAVSADLYDHAEVAMLPAEALQASLGCGNPTALASLRTGEVVLDLGSGGGIDVLLSARRVGPTGKAYGLDMTDEMLTLAEENKKRSGLTNVEFLRGEIEAIPLPDDSVDVIISNCVINLSADKDRVLREAHRVLRPGGRFAVSDIVLRGQLPEDLRADARLWAGCFAGALDESEYRDKLTAAGFGDVEVQYTRVFTAQEVRDFLTSEHIRTEGRDEVLADTVGSAFVRATKP